MAENADVSYPRIPHSLVYKIRYLNECSYGAIRVTLLLKDGRAIFDVILSDTIGEIAKVGFKLVTSARDLDFSVDDIIDVLRG